MCLDELCYRVAQHTNVSSSWEAFIGDWQRDVLRPTRKDLSHCGAIPCTFAWEPKHWYESAPGGARAASEWRYDAGNDVYAFSIAVAFPGAPSAKQHNSEFLGDVLEGILGLCWVCGKTIGLAKILMLASKYIYGLKALLVLDSFDRLGLKYGPPEV